MIKPAPVDYDRGALLRPLPPEPVNPSPALPGRAIGWQGDKQENVNHLRNDLLKPRITSGAIDHDRVVVPSQQLEQASELLDIQPSRRQRQYL